MATPNYGYEKRQKELAKKRKKEDKLKSKTERRSDTAAHTAGEDAAVPEPHPPLSPDITAPHS